MNSRAAFLDRVRQAVAEGNRAAHHHPSSELPLRGSVGYQGAGSDPVERFCSEFKTAGGHPYLAPQRATACRLILDLVQARNGRRVLLSRGGLIDRLELPAFLRAAGLEVLSADVDGKAVRSSLDPYFTADVGISNVEHLIAETGTIVMSAKPDEPRSASLLPPVHIALADRKQILPDLFDLFDLFAPPPGSGVPTPSSCLTLITGPSKTGDIELRLVTGVHGPGEVHVVLCTW